MAKQQVRIKSRAFGPGRGQLQRKPVPMTQRKQMMGIFAEGFKRDPKRPRVYLESNTLQRVFVDIRPVGEGAGLALWLRPNAEKKLRTKAVSVLMSGVDLNADAKAFTALRYAGRRLRFPRKVYEEIGQEPRPVVATLFIERKEFEEDLLVAAGESLAVVFFQPVLARVAQRLPEEKKQG